MAGRSCHLYFQFHFEKRESTNSSGLTESLLNSRLVECLSAKLNRVTEEYYTDYSQRNV